MAFDFLFNLLSNLNITGTRNPTQMFFNNSCQTWKSTMKNKLLTNHAAAASEKWR